MLRYLTIMRNLFQNSRKMKKNCSENEPNCSTLGKFVCLWEFLNDSSCILIIKILLSPRVLIFVLWKTSFNSPQHQLVAIGHFNFWLTFDDFKYELMCKQVTASIYFWRWQFIPYCLNKCYNQTCYKTRHSLYSAETCKLLARFWFNIITHFWGKKLVVECLSYAILFALLKIENVWKFEFWGSGLNHYINLLANILKVLS